MTDARTMHDTPDMGEGALRADAATAPPVILVDEQDRAIGRAEKLAAHESGALHRAVSVFAFDATGALLVQRRAAGKYHSGGLWSNSACTHPREHESTDDAARRCLREEMGVSCRTLEPAFAFIYRAQVSATLVEHEFDHVFVARVTDRPQPNADEVESWRATTLPQVEAEVEADPSRFSAWFPLALAGLRPLEVTARATRALPAMDADD